VECVRERKHSEIDAGNKCLRKLCQLLLSARARAFIDLIAQFKLVSSQERQNIRQNFMIIKQKILDFFGSEKKIRESVLKNFKIVDIKTPLLIQIFR
jgi:hypothetical protein